MCHASPRRGRTCDSVDVVPVEVLREWGGVATWQQLRSVGVGWYPVWRELTAGSLQRVRRGVYALPDAPPDLRAAAQLGGLLSCASAAQHLGLPVLTVPREIHVVVPRAWSHCRLDGVLVHRRDLVLEDRDVFSTGLQRTVLDCAGELPMRDAVVVCDAALRVGLDRDELVAAARRCRGRAASRIRDVVTRSDVRSESPLESCLRLVAAGLGDVEAQVWIAGVGRVDLVVDGWLVLEADGFSHHSTREHYREDRRRLNALAAAGYVLLRFTYEDVVHHEARVAETIRQVLTRGR